ncbi:MAG: hypothetical protein RIT45_2449 [Pseudomonadota bacterium]|jgi:hypothetical protein
MFRPLYRRTLAGAAALSLLAGPTIASAIEATAVDAPSAATPSDAKTTIEVTAGARAGAERSSAFAADNNGAQAPSDAEIGSRVTLSLRADTHASMRGARLEAVATVDSAGVWSGTPTLAGDRRPGDVSAPAMLTEAWASLSIGGDSDTNHLVGVRAGLQRSHWGLGLLANDGRSYLGSDATSWFQYSWIGDRVLRGQFWARPWAQSNSPLRGLLLTAAVDRVASDDVLAPLQNPGFLAFHDTDVAWQGIFAARMMLSKRDSVGIYYVYRDQQQSGGGGIAVHAVDAAFDIGVIERDGMTLRLSGEAVGLFGTTTLAPTPEFPEHDVAQSAAVVRAHLTLGKLQGLLDIGWFSGDASTDDSSINNFKADPNFQQGILLFRRIVGWQTARMRGTASDPDVVGYPNQDLDRLASGGAVTSALTFFPRVGGNLGPVEVYGGVLIALSPQPIQDPYWTRTQGGGAARNVYAAEPDGMLLGTELDGGVRARFVLPGKMLLLAGVEYGVALPGGALAGMDTASGGSATVHGGRVVLTLTGAPNQGGK